jgi:hypothetical protein
LPTRAAPAAAVRNEPPAAAAGDRGDPAGPTDCIRIRPSSTALDPDGARLKAYHYQLWVDPPVRMLQRRLIGALRDAKLSDVVTDRIPNEVDALRIEGRLERFERIRVAENEWKVVAMLSLRADLRDGKPPLLLREYTQDGPRRGARPYAIR